MEFTGQRAELAAGWGAPPLEGREAHEEGSVTGGSVEARMGVRPQVAT